MVKFICVMLLAFSEGKDTHFTSCSVLDGSSRFIRTVALVLVANGIVTRFHEGLIGEVTSPSGPLRRMVKHTARSY